MLLVEIVAAAAAAALLVMARGRRVRARRQKARMLRRALSSADPAVRRAAIQVAGDEGLTRSADVFLCLLGKETDAAVLLTLAEVVIRNQWEPAADPNMVRLRLWAHRHLERVAPQERPAGAGHATGGYEGPSAGEIVNLLLHPPTSTKSRHRASRPWA